MNIYLIGLILSTLLIVITFSLVSKAKKRNSLRTFFLLGLACLFICCIGLLIQILLGNVLGIPLVYYEYFVYIGSCFLPVIFLFMSLAFSNEKLKFKKKHCILFIISFFFLLTLWTNDYHHLFYKSYSIYLNEIVSGPFCVMLLIYTYSLILLGMFIFLKNSLKNSSVFSMQSLLIIIGALIPVIINILGALNIISMSIYITPMSFVFAMLCISLAIFKYGFLDVVPIALQRIVNVMSDAYIVLDKDLSITDFNTAFIKLFNTSSIKARNISFKEILKTDKSFKSNSKSVLEAIEKSISNPDSTIKIQEYFSSINKYFNIEINSIIYNNNFLGTLILLKDVTQHIEDMQELKNNQEVLIEKERLASLGQMIGGIAHNLKTPIMSIAGAAQGLSDLINEYELSVDNPQVTPEDHKAIANDMHTWIAKMKTHLSYMSDIITAVKGQAVNFADNTYNGFTIGELVKYVDILMKHELKNALITMSTNVNLPEDTKLTGNINSLVQVINNIISNAIQAYGGKIDQQIIFNLNKENSNLVMRIQDFAGGLPQEVQDKLFKEMITTKGKNGTGLGLFMSYSNIKGHFNGNLEFKVDEGIGTTFIITIPLV